MQGVGTLRRGQIHYAGGGEMVNEVDHYALLGRLQNYRSRFSEFYHQPSVTKTLNFLVFHQSLITFLFDYKSRMQQYSPCDTKPECSYIHLLPCFQTCTPRMAVSVGSQLTLRQPVTSRATLNWVRLTENWTNLGLFELSVSEKTKMY